MALLGLGGGVVERSAPGLGVEGRLGQAVRDGPAGTRRQLGQEGLVVTEPLVVRDQLEDPVAGTAYRVTDGVVPGTRPCFERCRIVLDVEKPNAPAPRASSTSLAISATSSSVASSWARSPST